MREYLERYGSTLFLGLPFICYTAQAALFKAQGRLGLSLMLGGYAVALVGQWLDTKGI